MEHMVALAPPTLGAGAAPPPVFGEDGEHHLLLLNSVGLDVGEVAEAGALINGAPEAEVGRAEDDAPPRTRDAPLPVFGEHRVALVNSTGMGGGETARHGALINGTPEAEVGRAEDDQAQQAAQGRWWVRGACVTIFRTAYGTSRLLCAISREPVFINVAAFLPDSEKVIAALAAASYLIGVVVHPAARRGADHQESPPRGWVRAAWTILRRTADAASRLLCYIARNPVVHHVATFLPGSEDLIVALAAAPYLVAHYATGRGADHQPVLAQEHRPRGWVRGAWLVLPFAPAAAYLLAASFIDAPLANGVASLVFLLAVAAFATLPRN